MRGVHSLSGGVWGNRMHGLEATMASGVGGEAGVGAHVTPISPHVDIYSYRGDAQTNIR